MAGADKNATAVVVDSEAYAFLFGMQIMPLVNRGDAKTMKIAVWVIFSIVTLLWTAGTFITVKLTQWGTSLLANGNIDPLSRGAGVHGPG